jgi:acetyl esterase/lipase
MTGARRTTRPPFDPEVAAALHALGDQAPAVTVTPDMIQEIRAAASSSVTQAVVDSSDEALSRGGAFVVSERTVPGPVGEPDISLVIIRPATRTQRAPGMYVVHGGAMIAGDARMLLTPYLDWAYEHGAVIVSVNYRLAPENPDPAPAEDSYAGLLWTGNHLAELGIDPDHLLIVGVSAGAGIAAGVTLMARDRGGPKLCGQLLQAPMLDDRMITHSSVMLDGEGMCDLTSVLTGWNALLGDRRGGPNVTSYAAPSRETNLANLPATFIDVGSADGFRDEAIEYASGIWRAGGVAELHVWPGGIHAYDSLAPEARISVESLGVRSNWVRRIWNTEQIVHDV